MGKIREALSHAKGSVCHHITVKHNWTEMSAEKPVVPQKWYFYNLKQSIDDPHVPFSVAALDTVSSREFAAADLSTESEFPHQPTKSSKPLCDESESFFSQTTMRKTISPVVEWLPFSPCDNHRLSNASSSDEPLGVGHERLLFEVHNLSRLRPIYWSIPYSTKVSASHWVFADTLTPIDPAWDEAVILHFVNFIENIETYTEILHKSQMEPMLMKVIAQRQELKQSGKTLSVDFLFSPITSKVYIFKADSTYICSTKTSAALLHGEVPRGVLAVLTPFEFKEYKETFNVPDRLSDDYNYKPFPVNNLILVFHGIGQKLSTNYTRINFIYAIDKLRVEILKATESQEVHNYFPEGSNATVRNLVLAVNWRSAFNSESNLNINNVTVKSLLPIRQAFSDALLDIPLYMSENRRPAMLAAAANEANRIFNLVLKHHPTFLREGRTHVVGHSLGSLITADLLTNQPTKLTDSNISQAPFKFQTSNYFITGSMLGVFMLVKNKRLIPRKEFESEYGSEAERPLGCFAVDNIYNMIHQSDLLSFLVNSTVEGAENPLVERLTGKEGISLEADEIPNYLEASSSSSSLVSPTKVSSSESKGSQEPLEKSPPSNLKIDVEDKHHVSHNSLPSPGKDFGNEEGFNGGNTNRSSFSQFLSSSISRFTNFDKSNDRTEEVEDVENIPDDIDKLLLRFQMLNDNGQIDWKIPQQASYIPSHYLKMFTAHFDYWSNPEMARFLAIECGRLSGVHHTLPEHRVKWTFKKEQRKQ